MTSTSAERVALILDCLGHEDTELSGQPRLWRHSDGRYLTEEEAAIIEESTLGEIRDAMDLWQEQLKQEEERCQLQAEFLALIGPHGPSETIGAALARLPEAEAKRAAEIWQHLSPHFQAWRRDQEGTTA
jgi:hypothetical protein